MFLLAPCAGHRLERLQGRLVRSAASAGGKRQHVAGLLPVGDLDFIGPH